ncbi:MAG TPA: EthD domain-containing protein [Eoetvoesiella sp.]
MVKHISIVKRRNDISRDEFRDYWINVHSEIVKSCLPSLKKYVANFPMAANEGQKMPGSGQEIACDAIVELHFDSVSDLLADMSAEGWLSEKRKLSSAKLIDLSWHQFVVAEEYIALS